ncbi:MAG TPA: Ig-like domain-containing protein, partial [Candidatus Ozemobacteraceae bacterium]|nr:Ig-like domain-containing protein [Candidatus Ozemobacteraceae bacterium]
PLELGTLREAPIKVYQGRTPIGIDYRLSRDLKTITLVPRTALKPNQEYSVAITTQLAGASGSRLPKTTLIPFRVADQSAATDYEVPQHVLEEAPPEPGDTSFDAAPSSALPSRRAAPVAAVPATPLKIVAMTPRQGETITNLSQPISIVFNQDVRPETLNEFTFRVEDDFGPIPAKIRYIPERRQGVLTPVGVLDLQKTYRVIVTQGISDNAGGRLAKGISASFSTQSPVNTPSTPEMFASAETAPTPVRQAKPRAPSSGRGLVPESFPDTAVRVPARSPSREVSHTDPRRESRELEVIDDESDQMSVSADMEEVVDEQPRSAPARKTSQRKSREALSTFKITGISPSANAENVKRDGRITLQFSDPANPSTLDEVNISVFANQRRVEGRVSYDSRQQRAVFIPSEPFDAETNYKVRISDKIRSAIGEPLMGKYSWEFTTGTERRPSYVPRGVMEADAAFSIPLADRRTVATRPAAEPGTGASSSFAYISPKHWAFRSIKHMHSKGLLVTYPFTNKDRVTRYECAMSVNTILSTLKSLQNRPTPTQLRVADLVELEHLVIEFRPELKSLRTNPAWFEQFLQNQGVNLAEVQARVAQRNRG